MWRGFAGVGRCLLASGSERAGGGQGSAQPSEGRWLLGSAAAARALWSSRPGGGGGEGAGEDRVRAAPLARIPHLPGRAGTAGTGSVGHRGKRWCGDQTEWNEVDSGKGWADTEVC
jgi:hypothetical protein